ncbi:MAG: hypothetical protein K2Q22_04950, partial [Cytophagales bacterium]|nr:hypothetical protein [Cytophagales bacterium]
MKSESIMFESNLGIKLFLDADIYKLKENMELAPSEPAIVSETLFAAPNSPTPEKPSAKLLVLV